MTKKERAFDFEKAYEDVLAQAKENGCENDMVFQTLIREFKRMKEVCDKLYENIEATGVCYVEVGTKGQDIFKSNPLTKEYVSAHKTLVSTCSALKDYLSKFKLADDDFLQ